MNVIVKIIVAALAFYAVIAFIAPLLTPIAPPLGIIILILILLGIVWWLLGSPLLP